MILTLCCGTFLSYAALAESLVPPPKPNIAPFIAETYSNDADGNRIDDELANKAQKALAAFKAAGTTKQKAEAQGALGKMIDVELVFRQPIIQKHIDQFIALGGEITYLYKAVSYGWNGRIPLGKVSEVCGAMAPTLVLMQEARPMRAALFEATQSGRVRPVWVPGFAGSVSGFEGGTNITIAFLDNGVDETHPDLAGRRVYRRNFTDEPTSASADHGTMVAGVAVGTGAAAGDTASTLLFTQVRDLSSLATGGIWLAPFGFPTGQVAVTMSGLWNGGGSADIGFVSYDKGTTFGRPAFYDVTRVTSPFTHSFTLTGDTSRVFSPGLTHNGSNTYFALTCQVSNFAGLNDGFNKLRGVAPRCNWADAKIGHADGIVGSTSWYGAGIDDLVSQRIAMNVKIMNLTWMAGTDVTLRQKVNSAVNSGIVFTAVAGNGGENSTELERQISDPGRAAFALTVGAANDNNQLTAYTSHGFMPTYLSGPYAEDHKPDLIAPGGSAYYTYILAPDSNDNDWPFPDQQRDDYQVRSGTSFAAPFAAGCAALVIQAMQEQGVQWDFTSGRHALFVKMLLCATACESNLPREDSRFSPSLQRAANGPTGYPASKDLYEGYGMINPDAAVEAVCLTCTNGDHYTASLGLAMSDRRAWARTVTLVAGQMFVANLSVPSTGDFDCYLYSCQPGTYGAPTILASSTRPGIGVSETLNYLPAANGTGIVVVKRVSGSGEFSLLTDVAAPPLLAAPALNGSDLTLSFQTVAGRTYYIEYKGSLNDPAWQQMGSVLGEGDVRSMTDTIAADGQRFYRLKVQ